MAQRNGPRSGSGRRGVQVVPAGSPSPGGREAALLASQWRRGATPRRLAPRSRAAEARPQGPAGATDRASRPVPAHGPALHETGEDHIAHNRGRRHHAVERSAARHSARSSGHSQGAGGSGLSSAAMATSARGMPVGLSPAVYYTGGIRPPQGLRCARRVAACGSRTLSVVLTDQLINAWLLTSLAACMDYTAKAPSLFAPAA